MHDQMMLFSSCSHFRPGLLSHPATTVEAYRGAPGITRAGYESMRENKQMQQRRQAAIVGAVLTVLILALFLVAAHRQGILPGFGTF
jgi:hypothetical protein